MKDYNPESEWDRERLSQLRAEPWMVEQLGLNPSYVHWSPGDDCMGGDGDGWDSRMTSGSWSALGSTLDEWNEVVHFHFEIVRDSEACDACGGRGYGPHAMLVYDSLYRHLSPFRMARPGTLQLMREARELYGEAWAEFESDMMRHQTWSDRITQDEVQALVDAGRLYDFTRHFVQGEGWVRNDPPTVPTADEVNAWARGPGLGHDSLNHGILTRARCARLGVPLYCETCGGEGSIYTEAAAHLELVLWVLHPRKGASRGARIKRVEQTDLPAVYAFLREAAQRNADRFGSIPAP